MQAIAAVLVPVVAMVAVVIFGVWLLAKCYERFSVSDDIEWLDEPKKKDRK